MHAVQVIVPRDGRSCGSGFTHAKLFVVTQIIFNAAAIDSKFTTADQRLRQSGIPPQKIPIDTRAATLTPQNAA